MFFEALPLVVPAALAFLIFRSRRAPRFPARRVIEFSPLSIDEALLRAKKRDRHGHIVP